MKIDPALVRRLRDERAWSQEHLAAVAGLSLRTIQRVESEGAASLDTRMALAAAFDLPVAGFAPPPATARTPAASDAPAAGPAPAVATPAARRPRRRESLTVSVLWAAAIIASAILHAPALLCTVLLPVLAFGSLLALQPARSWSGRCRS